MNNEFIDNSIFRRMAGLVQVRDLVTPFSCRVWEEELGDLSVSDLIDRGAVFGRPVLAHDMYETPTGVLFDPLIPRDTSDASEPLNSTAGFKSSGAIDTKSFLSADTTLFDALEILRQSARDWFVVIDGPELSGVFRFSDVMKPAARMCLFAMTTEFETVSLALCGHFAKECWAALPQGRQKKTTSTFTLRCTPRMKELVGKMGEDEAAPYRLLLDCTTLIDKATMICRCKLTAEPDSRIKDTTKRIERLRNACAHPALIDDGVPLGLDELVTLIRDCHDLIDSFRRVIPKPQTVQDKEDE